MNCTLTVYNCEIQLLWLFPCLTSVKKKVRNWVNLLLEFLGRSVHGTLDIFGTVRYGTVDILRQNQTFKIISNKEPWFELWSKVDVRSPTNEYQRHLDQLL